MTPADHYAPSFSDYANGSAHLADTSTAHWLIRVGMAVVVARRAPAVIAVSPYIEDHFRRRMHYQGDIVVVPSLLSTCRSEACSAENGYPTYRQERTAPPLSRFSVHGPRSPRLRPLLPESSLKMGGQGLHQAVQRSGGSPSVHSLMESPSSVPFLTSRYSNRSQRLTFLVHPSLEESCCLVIGGAQLAGCK